MTEARYVGPPEPDEEAREDVLQEAAADEESAAPDDARDPAAEGLRGSEPQTLPAEVPVAEADEEPVEADEEPVEADEEPAEAEEGADGVDDDGEPALLRPPEHAGGVLGIPEGYSVVEGSSRGGRRAVAIVVSRFNGDVTRRLLVSALGELERAGVHREAVTIVPVPGAFELPLGAMAFAKTRRFACVVALGCVIRGETAHFEYVSGEAASGLQLAALETGVPVAFGVLTVENREQALARIDKGAEAVRSALEMADLFAQLRQTAASAAR